MVHHAQVMPVAGLQARMRQLVSSSAAAGQAAPAPTPSTAAANPNEARQLHNQQQATVFEQPGVVKEFLEELPPQIQERLKKIVESVPGLGEASRVIDVGSGTGCLIPYMQARGVKVGVQRCMPCMWAVLSLALS